MSLAAVKNAEQGPVGGQEKPWLRQSGESTLWFNRFTVYLELGPKRSLRAAVAKERASIRLVKEPQKAPVKGSRAKKAAEVQPVVIPAEVPGSWKQASRSWRWVERCKAFDEWQTARLVDIMYRKMQLSYANKIERVMALDQLAKNVLENLNKALARGGMGNADYIALIGQVQALFRDLARETHALDEDIAKALMRPSAAAEIVKLKS